MSACNISTGNNLSTAYIQTGYILNDENTQLGGKVKFKDGETKFKGYVPDNSGNVQLVRESTFTGYSPSMARTLVVPAAAPVCKVYQDGNTIISKCPATSCVTNCNTNITTGVPIEREATFLGYFPKTCENVILTPAPVPDTEEVTNLEPAPEPMPVEVSCRHRRHRCSY